MSLNALGLGFLFTATDLASGVMSDVNKNFKGLEEQAGKSIGNIDEMTAKLGAGLATAAIGVGGLAASFSLAGKSGEFEYALAQVGAVSNASAEELDLLKKAAIQAGIATQFSPTEAVKGLNELAQAGYDAKESIALLNPVLDLAAGSLGDLSPQEAAGLAAQSLKAFGIDAQFAARAVDQMLQSANAFAVKPADLALGLGVVSSGAQTLNQSLTETVIAFGLVKNVIPGTERAATSVKLAMENLANPKVQKALRSQHVAVLDANGGYRRFLDIIKDLTPALAKMSEGDRGAFLLKTFGAEGLAGVNALMSQFNAGIKGADGTIRKGGESVDYLRTQFAAANGVAKDFAKKTLDTFEGSQVLLHGSMETLAIEVGEPFKNIFRPMVELITTLVNFAINALEGMSPGVKKFAAAIVVGTFALTTLIGVVLLAQAAWPLIVGGMGLVSAAFVDLAVSAGTALLALWPFALAGIAIAAVVYAIRNNIGGMGDVWDRVVEKFSGGGKVLQSIFDTVVNYAAALWDSLSSGFNEAFATLGPVFEDLGRAVDTLMAAFGDLGSQFGETSSGPGQGMLSFVKFLGAAIGDLVGILVTAIKWFTVFAAAVVEVFSGIAAVVKPIIMGIVDSLSFWIEKISFLVDKITGAWEMFKAIMAGPSALQNSPTVNGERGIVDHSNDARGSTNTRGLGPVVPDKIELKDQGKMTGLTPAIGALSPAQVQPLSAQGETAGIDYDKLAAAVAKQPIQVNIDGEKLALAVARGSRTTAARTSGRDHDEP